MKNSMTCPGCGAVMNHHADKITYTDDGERLNEFYECPTCGASASREAMIADLGG